ncbi:MAG TPA: phospholipase A [Nevskiaceae bacterium]|nr:phospholipase A [Nevskiaceae bacterium]
MRAAGWLVALALLASPTARAEGWRDALADWWDRRDCVDPPATGGAEEALPRARRGVFDNFERDPSEIRIFNEACGLSSHKPMYLLLHSYSPDYDGRESEVLFGVSLKQRVLDYPIYLAYTQRSFFQVHNEPRSRPFRTSDYNPEAYYRWAPGRLPLAGWGLDLGAEHESNGEDLPLSRSWNRLYLQGFRGFGRKQAVSVKLWYRFPEERRDSPTDPTGDDNPDIEDFLGYGELRWWRLTGSLGQLEALLRGNPATGHGAVQLQFTQPLPKSAVYFMGYVWHGYGESLLDYDRAITRIGIGFAFAR